jgi:hypothetical protein
MSRARGQRRPAPRAAPGLAALALACCAGAGACGGTEAKVLERTAGPTPPGSNLRVDVFLLRSVATCAVGEPCALADASQCFYLADQAGPRITFAPDTVQFLAPGDPQVASAPQSSCFRLGLDDAEVSAAGALTATLRTRVFQLTGGDIDLEVRTHEVATLEAAFTRYYTGPFLPPSALDAVGLPQVNRDTDFAFAITGFRDPDTGLLPKLDPCVGTNWLDKGGFGGTTYTWLAMSGACTQGSGLLRPWLIQLYFGLRDVMGVANAYANGYPACRRGTADPTRWFPYVDDCTADPDATGCGDAACPDSDAFYAHMLQAHWVKGRPYNGNYCSDGRMDYDETAVDSGGHCDLIGN